jgi:hypothetical protein
VRVFNFVPTDKMLAQRATQQSLRRRTCPSIPACYAVKSSHLSQDHILLTLNTVAAGQPSMISHFVMKRAFAPAAIVASIQTRCAPNCYSHLTPWPSTNQNTDPSQHKRYPPSPPTVSLPHNARSVLLALILPSTSHKSLGFCP